MTKTMTITMTLRQDPSPRAGVLIHGGTLVNVFSGETYPADVLCLGESIASVGAPGILTARAAAGDGLELVDAQGLYLLPGLINGHLHVESSLITPAEYGRAVLPHGTMTLVADPHEVANVLGLPGVMAMMDSAAASPVDFRWTAPSCVPASPLETAGADLGPAEVAQLLADDRVVALGEMMNYPGVIAQDPAIWAKLAAAHATGKPVDGHAPGLSGQDLDRYIAAGVSSDHEAVTLAEAWDKLRRGMWIMVRQGTVAHNLAALLPLACAMHGERMMLVTDDLHPGDLLDRGELNHCLRMAVAGGLDPVAAVRMATLNPASYFGLRDRGLIAPGRLADVWLVRDLSSFESAAVVRRGRLLWGGGCDPAPLTSDPAREAAFGLDSVRLPQDLSGKLQWTARGGVARVIGVEPGQVVTKALTWPVEIQSSGSAASSEGEVVKLAVVERHGRTGAVGLGLVHGLGLQRGAIGSTVAHDSHNLVLAGASDADMVLAASTLAGSGGGYAVVCDGKVLAHLPLPVAGLMSRQSAARVADSLHCIDEAARDLGCTLESAMMTLSFLSLSVIPALKLTDQGLVDVTTFRHVNLWL